MPSPRDHEPDHLSPEERNSYTHGSFFLEEPQRTVYADALRALNQSGPPYIVSGLYAMHQHTGIYRRTKDLDVMVRPHEVLHAARALEAAGFRMVLEDRHWLAKGYTDEIWVDVVFGMANGLQLVDDAWIDHAHPGHLAEQPIRVAAPEELIFHRLFIWERHRSDMADIVHLFLAHGPTMDWDRLLGRLRDYWRLLSAQIHFFDFVYPGRRDCIPGRVREGLLERAAKDSETRKVGQEDLDGLANICQGTLISPFSFAIDVNERGFRDYRAEAVEASRSLPVIEEIAGSDVWDEIKSNGDETVLEYQTSPAPWGGVPTGPQRGTP